MINCIFMIIVNETANNLLSTVIWKISWESLRNLFRWNVTGDYRLRLIIDAHEQRVDV